MTTDNTQTRKGFRWLCALVTVIAVTLPHLAFDSLMKMNPTLSSSLSSLSLYQTPNPGNLPKREIYVQPQWVDGGYGVQVLEPGHWGDPEKEQPLMRRPE